METSMARLDLSDTSDIKSICRPFSGMDASVVMEHVVKMLREESSIKGLTSDPFNTLFPTPAYEKVIVNLGGNGIRLSLYVLAVLCEMGDPIAKTVYERKLCKRVNRQKAYLVDYTDCLTFSNCHDTRRSPFLIQLIEKSNTMDIQNIAGQELVVYETRKDIPNSFSIRTLIFGGEYVEGYGRKIARMDGNGTCPIQPPKDWTVYDSA